MRVNFPSKRKVFLKKDNKSQPGFEHEFLVHCFGNVPANVTGVFSSIPHKHSWAVKAKAAKVWRGLLLSVLNSNDKNSPFVL